MLLCVGVQEGFFVKGWQRFHLWSSFLRSQCLGLSGFPFLQKEGIQTGNLCMWMQIKQLSASLDDVHEKISQDIWVMRGSCRSERWSKSLTWFEGVYSRAVNHTIYGYGHPPYGKYMALGHTICSPYPWGWIPLPVWYSHHYGWCTGQDSYMEWGSIEKSYLITNLDTNQDFNLNTLISENVMNSSVSKAQPLFDQHQSSDCLWVEACMVERNCITAS